MFNPLPNVDIFIFSVFFLFFYLSYKISDYNHQNIHFISCNLATDTRNLSNDAYHTCSDNYRISNAIIEIAWCKNQCKKWGEPFSDWCFFERHALEIFLGVSEESKVSPRRPSAVVQGESERERGVYKNSRRKIGGWEHKWRKAAVHCTVGGDGFSGEKRLRNADWQLTFIATPAAVLDEIMKTLSSPGLSSPRVIRVLQSISFDKFRDSSATVFMVLDGNVSFSLVKLQIMRVHKSADPLEHWPAGCKQ